MFAELDVVVVSTLLLPVRHVDGTQGCIRQPCPGDEGTVVQVLGQHDYVVECVEPDSGYTLWLAGFTLDELTLPPRDWRFAISEISAGVYQATGDGPSGMHVESTDADPTRATANCRSFAIRNPSGPSDR
jgi:hypothetical protein